MGTTLKQAEKFAKKLGLKKELVTLGRGLFWTWADIDPTLAADWLIHNFEKNRKKKGRSIEKVASDIVADQWEPDTGETIKFCDDNEHLIDGQNRLEAIVLAGRPILTAVIFGLPLHAAQVFDQGVQRSAKDAADIAGLDVSKRTIEVAKVCYNGIELRNPISNALALKIIQNKTYIGGIRWLDLKLPILSCKGVTTNASVRGAILRAYFNCLEIDPQAINRLERFCKVLAEGQYNGVKTDRLAFQLREKLLREYFHGRRKESYGLTEWAIYHFMMGDEMRNLRPTSSELCELGEVPTAQNQLAL